MANATKKKGTWDGGVQPLNLDVEKIRKLAEHHCTMAEIADIMECSVDTLERRYADIIKKARSAGKSSLRRTQYLKAEEGNVAMLIWLGKHYLDQKEDSPYKSNYEPDVRKLLSKMEGSLDGTNTPMVGHKEIADLCMETEKERRPL